MKDELKHIDELYKSNLENYQEEAGKEVWRNMRWILFWLRYRLLFGVASVVLLLGLLSLFLLITSTHQIILLSPKIIIPNLF